MKLVLLLAAALLWSGSALAQHKHGDTKGPNGGPMQDVAGVHVELVTAGATVTLNVFDEANKPVSTKGFSGSALVVTGANRETVVLAPSGENALKGDAKATIGSGAAITVIVKTAAGKSGQARY
ncbi:hypothetical protein [Reyranella sp. CPCC 100927]|uniref:hypothetical protein n=1 Tax=Reyranella sp. CPCC 100927 TaxID=2599616 RepID=UPI0011B50163|nr:hypothetical protein [Reyranella sp. CPCC 100927]TWT11492.1 hypothetical protein FQU96_13495 [Reyranella sp. CPCC 100927]